MLVAATNLHEYFREALISASHQTQVKITDLAEAYLVYLLSDFSRSERVYAGVEHGETQTLALLLARAQESAREEALQIYKHLGDSTLYTLGFFYDSMTQKAVSPDYYMSMGETGYSVAADMTRVTAVRSAALYAELADRFADLVLLLHAVSVYRAKS